MATKKCAGSLEASEAKAAKKKAQHKDVFAMQLRCGYVSTIITSTEDCKAKAQDLRQRRSQRKPLKNLEASEIYQSSRDEDLGVSRH